MPDKDEMMEQSLQEKVRKLEERVAELEKHLSEIQAPRGIPNISTETPSLHGG